MLGVATTPSSAEMAESRARDSSDSITKCFRRRVIADSRLWEICRFGCNLIMVPRLRCLVLLQFCSASHDFWLLFALTETPTGHWGFVYSRVSRTDWGYSRNG